MLRLVCTFAAFGALTLALLPFQAVAVALELPLRRRIPVLYHRLMCAILGVRIREIGGRMHEHPLLIVANHSSWLDITVISAVAPVVFVAKQEIARWPLFGLLAKLQRTVFVDRARRHKTREVNAAIAARLTGGDPVVLFGEGTASDGNRVLAFRSALVGAAGDAVAESEHTGRVWIQPLSRVYAAAGVAALAARTATCRLVWAHAHGPASRAGRPAWTDRRDRDVGRAGRVRPAIRSQGGRPRAGDGSPPPYGARPARAGRRICRPIGAAFLFAAKPAMTQVEAAAPPGIRPVRAALPVKAAA
jgi:1-acyl-sn-glycerol-3-phosphate acyltransferase